MKPEVPGTPKVQVEIVTPWGKQATSRQIDSNQIHPKTEFDYFWAQRLIPPARFPDMLLRMGTLLCGSSFVSSVLVALALPDWIALTLAGVALLMLCAALYACAKDGFLLMLLAGHVLLIVVGILLGVL